MSIIFTEIFSWEFFSTISYKLEVAKRIEIFIYSICWDFRIFIYPSNSLSVNSNKEITYFRKWFTRNKHNISLFPIFWKIKANPVFVQIIMHCCIIFCSRFCIHCWLVSRNGYNIIFSSFSIF